jgi:zona occludens toxin
MSIVIIHGGNGSYKSSTVVQDYIIPAIEEGRIVVTNIRGVCIKRFYDAGVDVHANSDIIYIDSDNTPVGKIGRDLLSCFWHWVPQDALLCFDESGVIFPKSWRDADLKKMPDVFKSSNGHEIFSDLQIESFDRPDSFTEAFEMHRHFGWDIVLSAPNIKSIRDDIRNTTELAWRHRNAALIGIKGRFKAVSHDPINNGAVASNILESKFGKIKQRTFDCYDSTKTGNSKDTANASHAILGSPRFLLAMAVSAGCLIYAFSSGGYDAFSSTHVKKLPADSVDISTKTNTGNVSGNISISQNVSGGDILIMGYLMSELRIIGKIGDDYSFLATDKEGLEYSLNQNNISDSGLMIVPKSDCHVILLASSLSRSVYCQLSPVISDDEYSEYLAEEINYDSNINDRSES